MFALNRSCLVSLTPIFNRTVSNKYINNREIVPIQDPIVLTDDGSTFVCLHEEKEFPYECTRPMPEVVPQKPTVLINSKEESMKVFGSKRPDNEISQELAKLTHTTIHRWFPKSRLLRKKKQLSNIDRKYL